MSPSSKRDNKFNAFFRVRPLPQMDLSPRPISAITTATHSTITPLPSDSQRLRHDDFHFPRSESRTSTSSFPRKLALSSFFGFSLSRRSSPSSKTPDRKASSSTSASDPNPTSARNRSFRFMSRPATPKSVDSASSKSPHPIPVPSSPLPLSASPRRRSFGLGSQRSTPKSSTGHLPLPHVQITHPPRSHGRRHSVGSERPPHDSAVALPEEPSHRTLHNPPPDSGRRNKGKEKQAILADPQSTPHIHSPYLDSTSRSLPADPSPMSRNFLSPHFSSRPPFSHLPTVDSASSEENDKPSLIVPLPLPAIPLIIHTPPTPQRLGEDLDSPHRVGPGSPKPKSVAITLVSASQSHPNVSSKGRFTPRFLSGKESKVTNPQKSTRRPPADPPVHKMPGLTITGPSRKMTSHRGKLGSFDFERPAFALNKSSSTVDTHIPTDNSSYSKTRLERTISEDSAQGGASHLAIHYIGQAESPTSSQLVPDHIGAISLSSISLQTKSTGKDIGTQAGQSSSWSRASGKHILRTSHGNFAFEHPSSVPNSPDPRNFNLPNDLSEHALGLPQSLPATPLHASLDARVKHSRGQSHNILDHVETGYLTGERKFKGKGRSLDLGLGLSWAPSRLREDVLMPGSILAREKEKLEKGRANGSDVTREFESLLSESRFQAFKKYVRRFDAHTIPLEGPSGLLARVEKLLGESGLDERERERLMSEFTVFVENHNE